MDKRQWKHRQSLIKERLLHSAADIVCIQEADGDTFESDFAFMMDNGYDFVLHRKFRFRCATFFLRDRFVLDQACHKDRTLVTSIRCKSTNRVLHLVNCHLSGGAAPERRLRQVHDGLQQIQKHINALERDLTQQRKGKRPSPKLVAKAEKALDEYQNAGIIVTGDFNSDGNTAVRKLLVEGCVEREWREPQYPTLVLSSKRLVHSFGGFIDAAELAYGGNVCDGDYSGEVHSLINGTRPATYVVPNLASLLLLPISEQEGPPRTQFGIQIARGVAETLNLNDWCSQELDRAFDLVDRDGNGSIDEDEILTLLETVYVETFGQQIDQERNNFFKGFGQGGSREGLTKEQFVTRLLALQQDVEGERKAFGLARGLGLQTLSALEMENIFERIDLDGNGLLDEDEFQRLLETSYVAIYGGEIENKRIEFFKAFKKDDELGIKELTKEQFTERLLALHQEIDGGRKGSELAEVRTEADVQKMIERFTPLLRDTLDEVFHKFSENGKTLTKEEANEFLIKANGELGRGGTFRHVTAILEKKKNELEDYPAELTLDNWYEVFARELAEGKWWQVVHDLEVCGSNIRAHWNKGTSRDQLYQGWLDYIYFGQKLKCIGVQEVLTDSERIRIFGDGDALPNEWHPSDHLPVSAVFSWE
jgi:Ca2+-binding EF-hand superfamily protein/endonuclease/exonuclease/phosphatase family metal-dependent hydrolase